MRSVNMHDAKTHFSRLVDEVASGESIVIAKAGTPVAKLTPLDAAVTTERRRTGFLIGRIAVPDDFDSMGGAALADDFERGA